MEFQEWEHVFLKVSLIKGVMCLDKKGQLALQYIGSFLIAKRIKKVAYQLELPKSLKAIHSVFHVNMLKKYILDETHVLKDELI